MSPPEKRKLSSMSFVMDVTLHSVSEQAGCCLEIERRPTVV